MGKGLGTAPGCGSGGTPEDSIALVRVGAGVGVSEGADAGSYEWAARVGAGAESSGLADG